MQQHQGSKYLYAVLPVILVFLSIIATDLLRNQGNNTGVIIVVSLSIAYAAFLFLRTPPSDAIYPFSIYAISLTLIFCFTLRSTHVLGWDIHREYYEYQNTSLLGYYYPQSLYSACLSITLLPSMLTIITGLSGEIVFNVIYPILISLIPVLLFLIYKKQLETNQAFAASLLYIAYYGFLFPAQRRTHISLLFVVAIVYFLVSRVPRNKEFAVLAIFMFGLITSHYTTSIFLLTLLGAATLYFRRSGSGEDQRYRTLMPKLLVVFLAFFFFWYILTIPLVGDITKNAIEKIVSQLVFFFEEDAPRRPGNGPFTPRSNLLSSQIGFLVGTLIRGASFLGALVVLLKKEDNRFNIHRFFRFLGPLMAILLVLFIVVPQVSITYNIERLYISAYIFLAPFIMIGLLFLLRLLKPLRLRSPTLFKTVVVLTILLQLAYASGLLSQLSGYSEYISFNTYEDVESVVQQNYYFFDQEVYAASWVSSFIPSQDLIYYDNTGGRLLLAYAGVPNRSPSDYFSWSFMNASWRSDASIFLRVENVVNNQIYTGMQPDGNSTAAHYESMEHLWPHLNGQNVIYSSGGTYIFRVIS